VFASAQSLSTDGNRLTVEVQKFVQLARTAQPLAQRVLDASDPRFLAMCALQA
jgi:hypothetical protein